MTKNGAQSAITSLNGQVKKHVGAIHTSGELSFLERKMANVLLLNAYDSLITERTHKIPVALMCAMLGWDESNNVDRLKGALRKLASTTIEFNLRKDGTEDWQVVSMLSFGRIKDGMCTYRYDEFLAERLFDPEIYATINIGMQRRFEGGYALNLYENCLRYKKTGSTGLMDIDLFRKIVGATAPMYDEFKYLKRDVITKPVNEINQVSDIHIEPKFEKNGRKVTHVTFLIKENPQQSLLKAEDLDQYADIRKNPTYIKLREHGILDRLALTWVMQDEERVKAIIEKVEAEDRQKLVKKSTGGYIRTLVEKGVEVGKTSYESKKEKSAKEKANGVLKTNRQTRLAELEEEFRKRLRQAAIKALTVEQRHAHAIAWLQTEKGRGQDYDYDPKTNDFRLVTNKVNFNQVYLRQAVEITVNPSSFAAWLQSEKGIDITKLVDVID